MCEICPAAFMEQAFLESALTDCKTWILCGWKRNGSQEEVTDLGIMTLSIPVCLHHTLREGGVQQNSVQISKHLINIIQDFSLCILSLERWPHWSSHEDFPSWRHGSESQRSKGQGSPMFLKPFCWAAWLFRAVQFEVRFRPLCWSRLTLDVLYFRMNTAPLGYHPWYIPSVRPLFKIRTFDTMGQQAEMWKSPESLAAQFRIK